MVVLVETASLEGDPDAAEYLGHVLLRTGATAWTFGCGVIGEGLFFLELFTTLLASVLVSRHLREEPFNEDLAL